VPLREDGKPDFQYVATHICDSIKRHLKAGGAQGIQGEFGIGLLSFWTVGEQLTMTNSGSDGRTYQLQMQKGSPRYTIEVKRSLFPDSGTELTIQPLLPGIRQLSGDKIQWYLASELRDRIRKSGVRIKVVDRTARKEYVVEPRRFTGRLLHELPAISTPGGEVYTELYLAEPDPGHEVGLYRSGTRVLRSLTELDAFRGKPWDSGYLQGIVDAPFLNLTPGTRSGVVQDAAFERFRAALQAIEAPLNRIIDEQRRAEEARASRKILDTIRKAFREAMLTLPAEEYDWFDIEGLRRRQANAGDSSAPAPDDQAPGDTLDSEAPAVDQGPQKQFFEYAGPLFSIRISPQSSVLPVGGSRNFRAVARDRSRIPVEHDVGFVWRVLEGGGVLANEHEKIDVYRALRTRFDPHRSDRSPAGRRLRSRSPDHGDRHLAAGSEAFGGTSPGPAQLHLPARRGRAVALALRFRASRHRHQQWAPGLRFRVAQPGAQTALHLPAVRQGDGAEKFPGLFAERTAGTDDRALALHRREPAVAPWPRWHV
jgi:hypothetical protein